MQQGIPCSSNILKRYKRNAVNGDIPHSKIIPINLENEIVETKKKCCAKDMSTEML